ncbi:MAG TPA: thiamine pyrophosphate-binding protein [Pirellulales bacterium]|jgi:sulfopyruvate decarboxylase TPP-binding subunit|nr:thiamine pyrophosphate-binding protein [Pirellulales bacterium]
MFSGPQVVDTLAELGITHVVWLPDSAIGPWEHALETAPRLRLIRVCREAEAWGIAAGLYLGGMRPLVLIQATGFFEGSDAMRNFLHDLKLPIFALVGYRSYLIPDSTDSVKRFTEPVLAAWGLDYVLLKQPADWFRFVEHYRRCQSERKPGVALLAEGQG